jgi:Secretion system C-terminal sorting domain
VYEYIAYVDTTAGVEWKYLNGNDWPFNESVSSGCQKGGGNSNRFYQATGDSKALDKVCFGSCVACATAPIPTYAFTFQVDMSNSDCDGGFDSVTVAGAGAKLTGFGAGLKMNKVGTSGVYSLTVADLDSGEVNFKYRFHKNNNTNWEGGDNRILPLAKNDTAKITCFGSRVVGNCPSKPAPSKITFIVDFTKTTIPPANKIYIMGDFTKPQWQAGAREMTQITGKPGVYSVVIDSICPGKLAYRFSNGDPNTAGEGLNDSTVTPCVEPNGVGGFNRTYTRTVATDVTISKLWNSCSVGYMPGSGVSELANISNLVKLYPNPTSTFTVVEFNDAAKLHNVVMMDVTGRVVRTIENYDLSTLRIDREDLKQGVYMINITNNLNQSANVKLVIE